MVVVQTANSQVNNEFPIGAYLNARNVPALYNSFNSTGMNTIVHFADENTKPYLNDYNLIANNQDYISPQDKHWINYYATGYYSKWDSEQNQTDIHRVGVKHKCGNVAEWKGISCWSSIGVTAPVCSLVYGPHYRQAKSYKGWTHQVDKPVFYTARFNMALDYDPHEVDQEEVVCVIKAVHRYIIDYPQAIDTLIDEILAQRILKVKDFNADGSFKKITLDPYFYDSRFDSQEAEEKQVNSVRNEKASGPTYSDSNGDNGIQFWVDWLRDDNLCTLYIDYAEVFDNNGWNDYLSNPGQAEQRIIDYAQSYDNSFTNIKYWYGHDEPYSLDAYTPMRTVDLILRENQNQYPALINAFYPYWDELVNGEPHLATYYNTVQPQTLMIDYYIFSPAYDPVIPSDLESMRKQFQTSSILQPGFWYVAQGFGVRDLATNNWCKYRRPSSSESKASVMLALAHGSKGILFWNYDSYTTDYCDVPGYFDCIVGMGPNYTTSDLYDLIRYNLVPRLKGTLGNTLLNQNYNGDYINYAKLDQFVDFLKIIPYGSDTNWHAGLLVDKNDQINKYFLLVNLNTTSSKPARLSIKNNSGYPNLRVRSVEDQSLDTTVYPQNAEVTLSDQTLQAGDGKLYQVAPVVKYGGKVKTSETITGAVTLLGEMTVESGATLTISGTCTYDITQNITVNSGASLVINPGATLRFAAGKSVIVKGTMYAIGNSSQRITFTSQSGTSPNSWGYIKLNGSGASGSQLRYANVQYGNMIEVTNVPNVTIQDCNITNTVYGINLIGSTGNIYANNISTSSSGHGIIIQNGSTATCERNIITKTGTSKTGVGIFYFQSSSGTLWQNDISGWLWGVGAFNSSPQFRKNPAASQYKNNRIKNCTYGVMAYQNSWPIIGTASTGYGYNSISIVYNTKNVYFTSGGELSALTNYWGGTPVPSMFYLGSGCTINTGGYLTNDPWQQQFAGDNTITINKESIYYGIELLGQNKLVEAKDFFISYLSKHPDHQAAYAMLYVCYNEATAEDLIKFFTNLSFKTAKENRMMLTYLYLKNGDVNSAKKTNNEIIEENWSTALSNSARLSNIYIALHYDHKVDEAILIYNDLLTKSELSSSVELSLVQAAIESYLSTNGGTVDKLFLPKENEGAANIEIPKQFDLLCNYPNPFNPTTKISYQLPVNAQVTLKVYDLLGREVATLVNEERQAGTHEIEFEARNLSSGIYLYKITMSDFTKTMKMIVVK